MSIVTYLQDFTNDTIVNSNELESYIDVAVKTRLPSLVRGTSGTLNGEVLSVGAVASLDCYFEYRKIGAASWSDTSADAETITAVGCFSKSISLDKNEHYEYRAVATWDDGGAQYEHGIIKTFYSSWVREGSQEDFERGILSSLVVNQNSLFLNSGYLTFNGTSSQVALPSGVYDGSSHYLTLSAWIYTEDAVSTQAIIYRGGATGLGADSSYTFRVSNGKLYLGVASKSVLAESVIWIGKQHWYHVAAVVNGNGAVKLFRNGFPVELLTSNNYNTSGVGLLEGWR